MPTLDFTCGGICCPSEGGSGDGSGSGDDTDVLICNEIVVHRPGHRTVTFAGLTCTFLGCYAPGSAVDNTSYTLFLQDCEGDDPCFPCYILGTLTTLEVLALHGLSIGIDCEGYGTAYDCAKFKYIGQVSCSGATVDAYLSFQLCFPLQPDPTNATLTISWILVIDDGGGPVAQLGGGISSTVAQISVQCFPGDITFLCPTGTGTFGIPISGDPSYAGTLEHATATSGDCCGDVTITIS